MFAHKRRHGLLHRIAGFTMIEMLTVIVIIMIVMALALPDFVHMMKERKWGAAIANIQAPVYGFYAGTDTRIDGTVPATQTQMSTTY